MQSCVGRIILKAMVECEGVAGFTLQDLLLLLHLGGSLYFMIVWLHCENQFEVRQEQM